jgi:hypothetical protein
MFKTQMAVFFIRNGKEGKESKSLERPRESVCARQRTVAKWGSIGHKNDR